MFIVLLHLTLAFGAIMNTATVIESTNNFKCKNATSNWPRCRAPTDGFRLRFGEAGTGNFPITAWWGPVGYSDGKNTSKEFKAYVNANFTIALVSDRTSTRCTGNVEKDSEDSWEFIVEQLRTCRENGMQALVDSYRCTPWGGIANYGGESQSSTINTYLTTRTNNHKITLPEVQWLGKNLLEYEEAVGILVTDDGVDLARNEIQEIEWMRENTPELFPWVNQCGDGSEWIARAGTPYAVPELYSVKGPGGNASAMSAVRTVHALFRNVDPQSLRSPR